MYTYTKSRALSSHFASASAELPDFVQDKLAVHAGRCGKRAEVMIMVERRSAYRTTSESYSVRTQISLSPRQREAIASVCRRTGVSMAELVRRAVDLYIAWQGGQETVAREVARSSYEDIDRIASLRDTLTTEMNADADSVLVSIPAHLLGEIDRLARLEQCSRSEFLQQAVRSYLRLVQQQRRPGQRPEVQQAVAIQDAIARQIKDDWDSTEEIRRWREARR